MRMSWIIIAGLLWVCSAAADVAPVTVTLGKPSAWIGERVPVFVELRTTGSFSGSASFDLPAISGATFVKVGNPVVSSQTLDGQQWFLQRHEFALFSQQAGLLEIPSFLVRFSSREGISGPVQDMRLKTSPTQIDIKQPPGSENLGLLVTTEALTVSETWEPKPERGKVGAIFKRTIVQRAEQVSGMALTPASMDAPVSVRVYRSAAEINDQMQRGDFIGERRETLNYLVTEAGSIELPALKFTWWNPTAETLESTQLPGISINVTAAAGTVQTKSILGLLALLLFGFGLVWQRRQLTSWGCYGWKMLYPPQRVAAKKLLQACRQHDAASAEKAWLAWRNLQTIRFQPNAKLAAAVLDVQRHRYGIATESSWRGDELAAVFSEYLANLKKQSTSLSAPVLPVLNP